MGTYLSSANLYNAHLMGADSGAPTLPVPISTAPTLLKEGTLMCEEQGGNA